MLTRLRASFEHERRFVADASHELRTPLALLRTSSSSLCGARDAAGARGGASLRVRRDRSALATRRRPAADRKSRAGVAADPASRRGRQNAPHRNRIAPSPPRGVARPHRLDGRDGRRRRGRQRSSRSGSRTSSRTPSPMGKVTSASSQRDATASSSCTWRMPGRAFRPRSSIARSTASAVPTTRAAAAGRGSASHRRPDRRGARRQGGRREQRGRRGRVAGAPPANLGSS